MNIKIYYITFLLLAFSVSTSCEKWTNVKPSIEVRSELVFSNEVMVQEALNGVYGKMTQTAGYGRHMTWGFVDVMGGFYDLTFLESYEAEAVAGKFDNSATESVVEEIWNNTYNGIANANNLITSIDKADPSIFSGNNRERIKGEALGLRAMLHFDLLRLFGPTVNSTAWSLPIMPYVTVYSSNPTARSNGADIAAKLLEDLQRAEELLQDDRIRSTDVVDELRARKVRFNYYAVKALQARVYLWIGNKSKALEAARGVIEAAPQKFPWTTVSNIEDVTSNTFHDYILSSENIFSLYVNNLRNYTNTKLINIAVDNSVTKNFLPHYSITEPMRQEIYESNGPGLTDFRTVRMIGSEVWGGSLTTILFKKLHQGIDGGQQRRPFSYAESRIPLIKVAEMFYVAAECLADIDPDQAVDYLNVVRMNRSIDTDYVLQQGLSATEVHAEIKKEYRKEFPCEGQFFFYRKRMGELNYILPLPQWEVEYGF